MSVFDLDLTPVLTLDEPRAGIHSRRTPRGVCGVITGAQGEEQTYRKVKKNINI